MTIHSSQSSLGRNATNDNPEEYPVDIGFIELLVVELPSMITMAMQPVIITTPALITPPNLIQFRLEFIKPITTMQSRVNGRRGDAEEICLQIERWVR